MSMGGIRVISSFGDQVRLERLFWCAVAFIDQRNNNNNRRRLSKQNQDGWGSVPWKLRVIFELRLRLKLRQCTGA